jgi:hypothetical protein
MIEDIILSHDRRGMNSLRKGLPLNFCERAAHFLNENADTVVVVTGFYLDGRCETDGPVGALMLAYALEVTGSEVKIVTDRLCHEVFQKMKIPFPVFDFPITGLSQSEKIGEDLITQLDPSVIVSIERCGRARDGRYYNMKGADISAHTAKIDLLFDFPKTLGIGDGGNEIGMGNIYDAVIKGVPHGDTIASVVRTTHLIISSVSNWGTYGLIAYLSRITGEKLLTQEDHILTEVVKAGAIDSFSRRSELKVDGYTVEMTNTIISRLCDWISISV